METKIFTPKFLDEIGFVLISEQKSKYPPYKSYGKAKDKFGYTYLHWNEQGNSCTYFGKELDQNTSLLISKDGDTRTAFNGYVFNQEDVKNVLRLTQ